MESSKLVPYDHRTRGSLNVVDSMVKAKLASSSASGGHLWKKRARLQGEILLL
jgi:hypothetical protein